MLHPSHVQLSLIVNLLPLHYSVVPGFSPGAVSRSYITVTRLSPKEEKAARVAPVPPERPAIYHRNKFGSDIRDIFAFRCLRRNSWFYLFARVGCSLPLQRAMILATRLLFSGGDN